MTKKGLGKTQWRRKGDKGKKLTFRLSVMQVLERALMSALALASLSSSFRKVMAFFIKAVRSSEILSDGAPSSVSDQDSLPRR